MRGVLNAESGAKVDYADIVDANTFEDVAGLRKACYAAIGARVGATRLIDNALIEPTEAAEELRVTL
jgi:pantothenate synthetase